MIHHTRLWTATVAAAALMALPITAAAQSTTAGQTGQQSGQYEQQSSKSPAYHLEQANKALNKIDDSTLTGSAASSIRELKQDFEQLRSAYNSGTLGSATSGTSGTSGTGTTGSGMTGSTTTSGDWRQSFNKIQQSLDQLNVPKSAAWMPITGTGTSGTSGTSGTGTSGTGTSGSGTSGTSTESSTSSIDPSVMSNLKEFRKHVEEFYKAAAGGGFDK